MENLKRGTPKDVFLHLLAVLTLYVSAVAFITLWWQYINVLFPDLLKYQDYYGGYMSYAYDPIRWAMATLIIVFPIHILISWLIGHEFKSDPEKREMRVRKWLWYITLFASAATIIIDLIILVYNFLKGELTTQFLLKIVVILFVASVVFGYYLWDLKKRTKPSSKPRFIAWIVSAVVLSSIIYGFFLIGTPATQRARKFDEQRVNDLSLLQNAIINYWVQKNKLPNKLNELNYISPFTPSGFIPPTDPETGMQYDYVAEDSLRFKLCAEFKTSSTDNTKVGVPVRILNVPAYQQNWNHDIGRTCFERTIDPELYKRGDDTPVPIKY